MVYSKSKLFWKIENGQKKIFLIDWQEKQQEYYSFVKEQIENGYHQISVTSEIMIELIGMVSMNEKNDIIKIEMMEEDSESETELMELVEQSYRNKGIILKLIKKLRYLEDESSIEIKRVSFSEKGINNKRNSVFVQVNGLIGYSAKESALIDTLINCIEGYLDE